jgi:hypothetical protein
MLPPRALTTLPLVSYYDASAAFPELRSPPVLLIRADFACGDEPQHLLIPAINSLCLTQVAAFSNFAGL